MAHEAVQKLQFLALFHAFLTREKSSSSQRLVDFLKNEYKVPSQKSYSFSGHLYSSIVFFDFFTRPRKKRDS